MAWLTTKIIIIVLVLQGILAPVAGTKKKTKAKKPSEADNNKAPIEITYAEMCDACQVSIDEYARRVFLAADNNAKRGSSQRKPLEPREIDGATIAKEMCEWFRKSPYLSHVHNGCTHILTQSYTAVFKPFNGLKMGEVDSIEPAHAPQTISHDVVLQVGFRPTQLTIPSFASSSVTYA